MILHAFGEILGLSNVEKATRILEDLDKAHVSYEKRRAIAITRPSKMAPQVGLEPTTLRLTAECSAIELLRNAGAHGEEWQAVRERVL